MKSKMRITGNRTVIGIICIVLALGITFGIAPLVNRFTDRKVEVVQVKQNVERGHLITEDDVELVKVGALNLSDRTVKNKKYVVGKYAATNLYAGQIMIADLVAEKSNSADDVLSALDGTKVAISVNIASFAQGLSNKLRNGDIVSVIVYDKETNQSHVPPELRYVKVITTTTGDSVDSDRKTDATQAITVTLLASPDQAKQLMPIGMLVVLDNILNRITANKEKGRRTYIFIDEIYLLFKHEYSANFLFTLWKRVRKYGAYITGITQNVEDLLQSHTARTMLANSELVVMLNQAATDRDELAELMGISELQMSYITNVDCGHGLVKIGGALVPFVNRVPKDTRLYELMTTKPGE